MAENKKIHILDSTLRDGAQGYKINFSTSDKLSIIHILDKAGIDYIEVGNPASNPRDAAIFEILKDEKLKHAKLVAFGSTRRKNTNVYDDKNLKALLSAATPVCTVFGKSSLFQVKEVLGTTDEENLKMIEESCRFIKVHGRELIFDAEHFFDGYKENKEYAVKCLKAAEKGGADLVCLCDTNGGTFPNEAAEIYEAATKAVKIPVGVHFHNDCGMAVASSVAATEKGTRHIQGTFLGIGERSGNANLINVICNLQIKLGYECIPQDRLKNLTLYAREMASINNTDIPYEMPYVGKAAFTHKAGMHAAAVLKNPSSFEHIDPYLVGNERRFPASEISGKAIVFERIKKIVPNLSSEGKEAEEILERIKEMESMGYQFEGADASFELLVRKKLGLFKSYFKLIYYRIYTGVGTPEDYNASATVKVQVGDELKLMASEGNGPVNALDTAVRKALEEFYPALKNVKLTDYKVRVLDGADAATGALVRVLITSTYNKRRYTTVGVSRDVVDASWKALEDSLEFLLMKLEEI
ncbi:MAG: citramalate synthase [Ruminococcaceae bacterium]|nr:citramalate synthase [Oscillospiraceae bacterium]